LGVDLKRYSTLDRASEMYQHMERVKDVLQELKKGEKIKIGEK
jgi:hypothetical protein